MEELREIVDRDSGEDRIYSLTLRLFPNTQSEAEPGEGLPAAKGARRPARGRGA